MLQIEMQFMFVIKKRFHFEMESPIMIITI